MKNIFLFIILPILFTVTGEFLLKYSVTGQAIAFDRLSLMLFLSTPGILLGVGLIGLSAVLWIIGMTKFQLSFMYPFLSLNYVIIIVGSEFFLHEDVQLNRYVAILLIVIGLVIISRSKNVKIKE